MQASQCGGRQYSRCVLDRSSNGGREEAVGLCLLVVRQLLWRICSQHFFWLTALVFSFVECGLCLCSFLRGHCSCCLLACNTCILSVTFWCCRSSRCGG